MEEVTINNKHEDDIYSQKFNENEMIALKNENNNLVTVV